MNKLTFIAITTLSVALAGCQKTNLKSTPKSSQAPANFTAGPAGPPPNPGVPLPPIQVPPPRFPEDEPLDPVLQPPVQPPVVVQPPPMPPRGTEAEPRDPVKPPITTPPTNVPTVPPVLTPTVRPVPVTTAPPTPPVPNPPVSRPPAPAPQVSTPPVPTPPAPTPAVTNPPVDRPRVTPVVNNPPVTQPVPNPPVAVNPPVRPQPRPTVTPPPATPPAVVAPPVTRPPVTPAPVATAPQPIPQQPNILSVRPHSRPVAPPEPVVASPNVRPRSRPLPKPELPVPVVPRTVNPAPPAKPVAKVELPSTPPQPSTRPQRRPPPPPVFESADGQCHVEPVTVAPKQEKNKLDIWFVVDTSGSIRKGPNDIPEGGELEKLAMEMENFASNIKAGTDINVGVTLAHGPDSPHYGKLFKDGDHPVLRSTDFKDRRQMWELLKQKMLKVPDDTWNPHQGEAPLMNIYAAIASNSKREAIMAKKDGKPTGLFREDANLAVIIVTDENDVCYQYPEELTKYTILDKESARAGHEGSFRAGLAPVLKHYIESKGSVLSPDHYEIEAQKRCGIKAADGTVNQVTPESVREKLEQIRVLMKGKLIVTGIFYKDNLGATMKAVTDNEDENEMAHGVIELVGNAASGDLAEVRKGKRDGAGVSFASTLNFLGQTTNFQSRQNVDFICRSGLNDGKGIHAAAIDLDTVELTIIQSDRAELDSFNQEKPNLSGFGSTIAKYSARCPAKGSCPYGDGGLIILPGGNNTIRVSPSDPVAYERMMRERGVDTAKYRISFRTKAGVNPQTGEGGTADFTARTSPQPAPKSPAPLSPGSKAPLPIVKSDRISGAQAVKPTNSAQPRVQATTTVPRPKPAAKRSNAI